MQSTTEFAVWEDKENPSELKVHLPVSGPLWYERPGRLQSEHSRRTGMKSPGGDLTGKKPEV